MPENNDNTGEGKDGEKFRGTNDYMAAGLFILLAALNVAYFWTTGGVPGWVAGLDTFGIGTSIVWTFGGAAAKQAAEVFKVGVKNS